MEKELFEPQSIKERIAALAPQTRTNVSTFELAKTESGLLRRMDHMIFDKHSKVKRVKGRIQTMGSHVKVYWNHKGVCRRVDNGKPFPQGDLMLKEVQL